MSCSTDKPTELQIVTVSLLCALFFVFGAVVTVCFWSPEAKVPCRRGDQVIVKTGFFAGSTGRLDTRYVDNNGKVRYSIEWDNKEKSHSGTLDEDVIMLIGGWDSFVPTKD